MYRLHNSGQPRQMTGSAMDLGAFEFTTGSAAQSVPAADFAAGATSVAAGQSVQFTDLSTGSPTSWSWDFGDGSPVSSEQHPLHIYQSAGTYTVSLTVANAGGSDAETKSSYITVTSSGSGGSGGSGGTSGSGDSGGGGGSGSNGGCFISSAAGFSR